MPAARIVPTGKERLFEADELIVSKTDPAGRITYANRVFQRVSGYSEQELLGQPHSLIRHPDMPAAVFKLLWDTISGGKEIFAYVVNLAKDGAHYWVLAHVTPTFDSRGQIVGYHSNRRLPSRKGVERASAVYTRMRALERSDLPRFEALERSTGLFLETLRLQRCDYNDFVFKV
jgi:PAS domain S-box-containing protein